MGVTELAVDRAAICRVVLGLDRWFDAMRVDWPTPGYGGPVVHWWNHCLGYRGTGLDWRYEGIVDGYLTLWRRTEDRCWLDKAVRAGEDLVAGQTTDGHFVNSRFELNPGQGGTPHEAACTVALLLLAKELRRLAEVAAERYLVAAERTLHGALLGRLWHGPSATLRDGTALDGFVANKAATFVEAVLLLAELGGEEALVARYATPTAEHILEMQVRASGAPLDGAIAQNRFGNRVVESYFPHYIARCIPALLQTWAATGEERFRAGALAAAGFVARVREHDGGLPQVVYRNGRQNRRPRWIAAAGDVVRALTLARDAGAAVDPEPTVGWIVRGARPDGRIAAASGFGLVVPWVSRRDAFADELGVVGWCDKAFRALAPLVAQFPLAPAASFEVATMATPEKVVR
jgi:hypothetical protein